MSQQFHERKLTEINQSVAKLLEIIRQLEAEVETIKQRANSDFAILSRACGNWREWPTGTVISQDAKTDYAHQDWLTASRAIIENVELKQQTEQLEAENAQLRQRLEQQQRKAA